MKKIIIALLTLVMFGLISAASLRIECNTSCDIIVYHRLLTGTRIVTRITHCGNYEVYLPYFDDHDIPGVATNGYSIIGSYSVIGRGLVPIEESIVVDDQNQFMTYRFNDPLKMNSTK